MSIDWEKAANSTTETQEFTSDPVVNQRIKDVCIGLQRGIAKKFINFPTDEDGALVASFLETCLRQENVKVKTKKMYVLGLDKLSKHFSYKKSFKEMTSQDIADFLGRLHRNEQKDPNGKWIGTQNPWASLILKFYKWVAYPNLTAQERKHLPREKYPEVLRQFDLSLLPHSELLHNPKIQ